MLPVTVLPATMLSAALLPRLPALPGRAPVELTREQAAELARAELADPAYHPPDDPILLRLFRWLTDRVEELVDRIGSASPGGWLGLLGLAVVVVAVLVVVRWRLGPVGRTGAAPGALFGSGTTVTAAEHRRRAEHAAAAGELAEAVRERLRAVVRDLEERGVLDPRPGVPRTRWRPPPAPPCPRSRPGSAGAPARSTRSGTAGARRPGPTTTTSSPWTRTSQRPGPWRLRPPAADRFTAAPR